MNTNYIINGLFVQYQKARRDINNNILEWLILLLRDFVTFAPDL